MAGTGRAGHRDLIAEIRSQGFRFRFTQAVRLLARSSRSRRLPAGVRFRTPVSLAFPASEIVDVTSRQAESDGEEGLEITVGFMGLTGPSGALPACYTELLIERQQHHRDTSAHAFLDLFSHRAIALFYEAWRKYRFYIGYEAGDTEGFTHHLLDLVGVGCPALLRRLGAPGAGLPLSFFAHFSGLLAQRPLSAASLAALIRGFFGVEAEIEQFVDQWQELADTECGRLGTQCCRLGEDAFCGQRVWDCRNRIRLRLGPLDRTRFEDFTPGSPGASALRELVAFCVGQGLACDVVLVLRKEAIPAPVLGESQSPRLGYDCWPRTRPPDADSDDMRFALLA